jgi:hypothetical protein
MSTEILGYFKKCQYKYCNAVFFDYWRNEQMFCSALCRNRDYNQVKPKTKTCLWCGEEFETYSHHRTCCKPSCSYYVYKKYNSKHVHKKNRKMLESKLNDLDKEFKNREILNCLKQQETLEIRKKIKRDMYAKKVKEAKKKKLPKNYKITKNNPMKSKEVFLKRIGVLK